MKARALQFCAGPQRHTFVACTEHETHLTADPPSCFLIIPSAPIVDVDPDDEPSCDFCREGGE